MIKEKKINNTNITTCLACYASQVEKRNGSQNWKIKMERIFCDENNENKNKIVLQA